MLWETQKTQIERPSSYVAQVAIAMLVQLAIQQFSLVIARRFSSYQELALVQACTIFVVNHSLIYDLLAAARTSCSPIEQHTLVLPALHSHQNDSPITSCVGAEVEWVRSPLAFYAS